MEKLFMENGTVKVLLTFDVELFLGKTSGTLENCIIKPTNLILEQLEKYSAVGTFFIDASYLLFLKKYSLDADLEKMGLLINKIEATNNEVALHIHPHWVDATYSEGNCHFTTYKNYSIDSFSGSYYEHCIKAHDLLTAYLSRSTIRSFRAGGYCSQPFSDIEKVFHKTDMYIDSSVVPGFKCFADPFSFDYTSVSETGPYKFSNDNVTPSKLGKNIELPVSCIQISGINRVFEKIKRLGRSETSYGDGSGLRFDNKFINRFRSTRKVLTLDDSSFQEINNALMCLDYANVVSHPKNFTPTSLSVLNKILENPKYRFYRCSDDF